MLRTITKLVAIAAGLTLSGQALAQSSDTESTQASITLADPIDMTEVTALRFGAVLKGSAGSSIVTINAATGARTLDNATGSGNAALVSGPATGRAEYTVTGEDNATFAITLPTNPTAITNGGTGSLALALALESTTGTLNGSGSATFGVGGTVTIDNTDANDVAGAYTATFVTQVAYN
jgi:hypothetical protein